jgi:hypothetical protein
MEAKLYVFILLRRWTQDSNVILRKSQRVADLRELLQKASVPIPAKANKADLIAKILASPAAIEAFNNPGSSITTTAATPKPKATESSQGGQDDDLVSAMRILVIRWQTQYIYYSLHPRRSRCFLFTSEARLSGFSRFDWGPASNGAQPTSATPETNAPKADSKPAAAKPAAETVRKRVITFTILELIILSISEGEWH